MKGLAQPDLLAVPEMAQATFDSLRAQARLQLESIGLERPKYEVVPPDPAINRLGLAMLPPHSPLDVFFDMEGDPLIEGGLEYLFGAVYLQEGKPEYKDWWAHDRPEERQAFEQFVDWIYARWQQDASMHVYHYADYELSAVKRLMGRFATREKEVDDLLRGGVFVDLYRVVRQGLRVGEPSYSIKYVEHLYRGKRAGDVVTAGGSVVAYTEWKEHPDGGDWTSSPILKSIRDYNRDDCESTWQLAGWLRGVQREHHIEYRRAVAASH